jgi:hypothetical protein
VVIERVVVHDSSVAKRSEEGNDLPFIPHRQIVIPGSSFLQPPVIFVAQNSK